MKGIAVILMLLLVFSGCTTRTVPTSAIMQTETESVPAENTVSVDLSPLSESSIGQALLGCVREVESVTIINRNSGEVAYESTDDVLSQSFYDAVQIVDEMQECIETVLHDYEAEFHTALGIQKTYLLWTQSRNAVIVQCEDEIWTLPQTESDWIRSRLTGLA